MASIRFTIIPFAVVIAAIMSNFTLAGELPDTGKELLSKCENAFLGKVAAPEAFGLAKVVAFEDHKDFIYVHGPLAKNPAEKKLTRAVLLIKPQLLIVFDYDPKNLGGYLPEIDSMGDKVSHDTSAKDNSCLAMITYGERSIKLTFRPDAEANSTIEITDKAGMPILPQRRLPAGILPAGESGANLLARWDRAYHNDRRPAWDTNKVAGELQKVIEDGTVKKGRAVVLGCGTGTNAIYLAEQGFDVVGIDIAPTALTRAEAKANKAGVKVKWVLADVLNTPDLGTCDFIFDRGCYHGVRRVSATGYVGTAKKLTKQGSQILILAGNANEEKHYGPPRVTEEAIRGDFTESFNFQWLRETHFNLTNTREGNKGPLMWSIHLKRK